MLVRPEVLLYYLESVGIFYIKNMIPPLYYAGGYFRLVYHKASKNKSSF